MKTNDQLYRKENLSLEKPKLVLDNTIHILDKFGLSSNQSKIYVCLSNLGTKTASQLSQILEIPRTETYHILKKLEEKGCISIINKKPKIFRAIPIEDVLEKLIFVEKNKINKLEETLETIKRLKISNLTTKKAF